MDKNDKEKQMLYEWGKEHSDSSQFQKIDEDRQSYFIQRGRDGNTGTYIREYGFETLPEFMQELDALWGDETVMTQMKKICAVAAMKNEITGRMPAHEAKEISGSQGMKTDREDKLPVYIYNF